MSDLIKKSNSIIDEATSEILIFERPSRATSSALIDVNTEMQARITELEQQLKQQWVSVDDVPIKESDMKGHYETVDVILSSPDGMFSGEFQCGKTIDYWSKFTSDGMIITNATHYMLIDSLPKPPTK